MSGTDPESSGYRNKMNVFIKTGNKTLVFSGTLLETSQNTAESKTSSEKPKQKKNRCFTCRKKIGLTGKTLTVRKPACSLSSRVL